MSSSGELDLSQALQRAFIEAGQPSISSVATGSGVSRQRLSDWRSGRHVPGRFEDLAPAIAYFRLVAGSNGDEAVAADGDCVTGWSDESWRQAWKRSTLATATAAPRALPLAVPPTETVDRRPLAIAVTSLLVFLVAALAITAFFLSWAYR